MKITKALFQVLFVLMLVMLLASCSSISSIKCMDPFNNHTIVIDAAVDPTCTSVGLTRGEHCKDCGKIFVAQSIIPEIDHTAVIDAAVEPTCTKEGRTQGSHCADCGKIFVEQKKVPMEKHNIVIIPAVPATCTTNGTTEGSKCVDCGQKFVEPDTILAGHVNTVEIPAYDSTCSSVGATKGLYCADCNKILVYGTIIPMKPHTESDWIIDKEATELKPGSKHTVCTVCNCVVKEDIVPQIAYFDYSVNTDGFTCTIVGVQVFADIELYIPEYLDGYKVTAIGDDAFIANKQIIAAYIPSTVTSIGKRAFSGCTDLADVNIPEGVDSIGMAAFRGCTSLEEIIIPCSVRKIGEFAFDLCDSVKNVYYCGTLDMWRNIVIGTNNDVITSTNNRYYYIEEDPRNTETGIFKDNGVMYFYSNGARKGAGLIVIDGAYYYVRTASDVKGMIVTNVKHWVSVTNNLLSSGYYTFGADGKMIDPPVEPTADTAITASYWHFVDGKPTKW